MGRLVCKMTINGEESLRVITTPNSAVVADLVKRYPGVGKPWWYWPSIPAGTVIGADFEGAPIASSNSVENAEALAAITATPEEKLIYA